MALTQITDHSDRAIELLAQQFRGNVQVEALVRAFVNRIQELENLTIDVLNSLDIDAAVGQQLDLIGAIIGESRQGREDAEYRLYIRARIRLNIGSGTGPDIIDILTFVLAGRSAELRQYYPASFVVELHGATTDEDAAEASAILISATAAGVGSQLIFSEEDDATSFFWASGDSEESSSTQGWSTDADDDAEGGVLSEVYEG